MTLHDAYLAPSNLGLSQLYKDITDLILDAGGNALEDIRQRAIESGLFSDVNPEDLQVTVTLDPNVTAVNGFRETSLSFTLPLLVSVRHKTSEELYVESVDRLLEDRMKGAEKCIVCGEVVSAEERLDTLHGIYHNREECYNGRDNPHIP